METPKIAPMTALTFDQDGIDRARALLDGDGWIVACLCAAWCDVCKAYRPAFDELAGRHPDKLFLWIDVEDHADLVGDIDIENFPTLLLQRADVVAFCGPVQPDIGVAARLLAAYAQKSTAQLRAEAPANPASAVWQEACNLRRLFAG